MLEAAQLAAAVVHDLGQVDLALVLLAVGAPALARQELCAVVELVGQLAALTGLVELAAAYKCQPPCTLCVSPWTEPRGGGLTSRSR